MTVQDGQGREKCSTVEIDRRFAEGDRVVTLVGWSHCYGACTSRVWRDPGLEGEVTFVDDDGVVTVYMGQFEAPCYVSFRADQLGHVDSERAA